MKKFFNLIENIIVLICLSTFPCLISMIIEFALTGDMKFTSDYIISILTLLGVIISAFVFRKKGIYKAKLNKIPLKTYIFISGLGFSLKPLIICILYFTISLNISNSTSLNFLSFLGSVLFFPIAEEILFRGILTDILNPSHSKSKFSISFTILVTSLLWTISHFHGINLASLLLLIDGIIIGALYQKYKSILVCIVYHSFNNLAVIVLFGFGEEMWIQRLIITALIFVTSFSFLIFTSKEKPKNI